MVFGLYYFYLFPSKVGADIRIRIRDGIIRIRVRKTGIRAVIRITAE